MNKSIMVLIVASIGFITSMELVSSVDVSVDDDPVKGSEDAPVTMIEFGDFQGPFCARFFTQTLPLIEENYIKTGKVKFVYRDFPLSFHQYAQKAAEATECADEQGKFWEYHDKLFENQQTWENIGESKFKKYADDLGLNTAKFNDCLDSGKYASEVQKDFRDGQSYGVRGTPSFYINGIPVTGALPYSEFQQVIEQELEKVTLTSKTGSIYVSSAPSGADVYLDGNYKGTTPMTITDVSIGSHTIKLTREGYEDYTTTFYIEAGQRRDITAQLTIKDSDGDGITDDIDQCPHQSETFNNYQDTDGCPDVVPPELEKEEGKIVEKPKEEAKCSIDLSTSPSADVFIDRRFIGKTPLKEKLSCGKYFLEVEKEGYESWEKVVELSEDSPVYEETITLSPSKKLEISDYEIEEKHLVLIPIILGVLGFLIKLFRG